MTKADESRRALRSVGEAPGSRDRVRVGRRKVKGADIVDVFPTWTVLPDCPLCWVRFEYGNVVANCSCIGEFLDGIPKEDE